MKLLFQTISITFLIVLSFSVIAKDIPTQDSIPDTNTSDSSQHNDDDTPKISVYPLPADKEFHIDIESQDSDKVKVKLINMESGSTTVLENKNVIGHSFSTFDVSLYPAGNYMLIVLEDDKRIYSKKILINHIGI